MVYSGLQRAEEPSLLDRCDGACTLSNSVGESERITGGEYVNRNKTHHS